MEGGRILRSSINPPEDFNRNRTVVEFVLEQCRERPENDEDFFMAESVTGNTIKFKDYDTLTQNIGSNLYDLGVRKGDFILYSTVCMVKSHLFFGGAWKANAALRSSYSEDTEETVRDALLESKIKVIFCDPADLTFYRNVVAAVAWEVKIISSGDDTEGCMNFQDLIKGAGKSCPELAIRGEDPAIILNTSGSTGKYKGAVFTHSGVLGMVQKMTVWPRVKCVVLVGRATISSVFNFPLFFLGVGAKSVHVSVPTLENISKAVEFYRGEVIVSFITFVLGLVNEAELSSSRNYDLSSLKAFFVGGAVLSPEIRKRLGDFNGGTAVIDGFGLTEIMVNISNIDLANTETYTAIDLPPGAIGKTTPGSLVKIVNFDTLEPVPPHVKGELWLKAASMKEYLNNPEETALAFTQDGFFRSGDIAYYDEDEFIYFCGRAKEIFKFYCYHISPSEIDEMVSRHPAVHEVCTIGIPNPGVGDTIPRVFVSLKAGAIATAEEIKEFANGRLASYKHLRGGLFILQEIPKGTTGKISRQLVRVLSDAEFP